MPDRLLWIKTTFDAGTPIALIAHTDFSKWQAHYVAKTLWTDEQFERRINRRVSLPAGHSRDDMQKIARAHLPGGDSAAGNSWQAMRAAQIRNKQAKLLKRFEARVIGLDEMAEQKSLSPRLRQR